jgi:hypothetical protein
MRLMVQRPTRFARQAGFLAILAPLNSLVDIDGHPFFVFGE